MFVQLHLSPVSKPQESQTETNILSEKVKKTCIKLIGRELNFKSSIKRSSCSDWGALHMCGIVAIVNTLTRDTETKQI